MKRFIVAAVAALTITASAGAAVQYQVEGGKLVKALGVEVAGSLYDVEFLKLASCESAFSGCVASSFTFSTLSQARGARDALKNTVLVNTPDYSFNSDPTLTYGCGVGQCAIIVPYALNIEDRVLVSAYFNTPSLSDQNVDGAINKGLSDGSYVYTRFTASSSNVPEPATWAMFIGGFGLIGGAMRRGRRERVADLKA